MNPLKKVLGDEKKATAKLILVATLLDDSRKDHRASTKFFA